MYRQQLALTLSELIRVVSECAQTGPTEELAVTALMQQGVIVRARPSVIRAMLRTVESGHKN